MTAVEAWDDLVVLCDRAGLSRHALQTYMGTSRQRLLAIRDKAREKLILERINGLRDRLQRGLTEGNLPCEFEIEGLMKFLRDKK